MPRDEIAKAFRSRLPAYMVPAYLEQLDAIPMTLSNKADLKRLPKPTSQRFAAACEIVEAKTESERALVATLCEILKLDAVSTQQHFFDDLGANSLLMARVLRENPPAIRACRMSRCATSTCTRRSRSSPTISTITVEGFVVGQAGSLPRSLRPLLLHLRRAAGARSTRLMRCSACGCSTPVMNGRSRRPAALELYARSVIFAAGSFLALTAISIDREMGAGRPLQGAIDPDLEPGLFPLLGRQDHDAHVAGHGFHRHADLQLLSARDGREDRPQRRDLLPLRPGLRRPVHHRRQHDPAQGHHRARLSRAVEFHPYRPGRDRRATPLSAKRA